jgi:hypothetical protein
VGFNLDVSPTNAFRTPDYEIPNCRPIPMTCCSRHTAFSLCRFAAKRSRLRIGPDITKGPGTAKPGPVSHGGTVLPLTKKLGQHDRNCSVYLRLICVNTVPRF